MQPRRASLSSEARVVFFSSLVVLLWVYQMVNLIGFSVLFGRTYSVVLMAVVGPMMPLLLGCFLWKCNSTGPPEILSEVDSESRQEKETSGRCSRAWTWWKKKCTFVAFHLSLSCVALVLIASWSLLPDSYETLNGRPMLQGWDSFFMSFRVLVIVCICACVCFSVAIALGWSVSAICLPSMCGLSPYNLTDRLLSCHSVSILERHVVSTTKRGTDEMDP